MRSYTNKDIKHRMTYAKTELLQRVLRVVYNYNENLTVRFILTKIITIWFSSYSYSVLVRNFCILSGRSRGIYKKYKLSRIFFRSLISVGLFFGLKKST
jgi:ribosomal protein S14